MRTTGVLLMAVLCLAGARSPRADYDKLKMQLGLDSGKRHLDYANLLEDRHIYPLALDQFRLASERSGGKIQHHANKAYSAMLNMAPAVISSRYRNPSAKERRGYRVKAGAEHARDRKGWKRLADFAASHPRELLTEALEGYRKLIDDTGEMVPFDEKGRLLLPEGAVRESLSEKLADSEGTIVVGEHKYLRNAFFKASPMVDQAEAVASKTLRIMSQEPLEEMAELLRLGDALLKILEKDFHDEPEGCLEVFLFDNRPSYAAFCRDSGNSANMGLDAFTDHARMTSIICLERTGGARMTMGTLHTLLLHELTHLFHFLINRTAMPDWYEEGLAETYGGAGTFQWDGKKLTVKGKLNRARIEALLEPDGLMDLNRFLSAQVRGDEAFVMRFYAQSWAFYGFLKGEEPKKLRAWEDDCFSYRLGREETREKFEMRFFKHLDRLDREFPRYLEKMIAQ